MRWMPFAGNYHNPYFDPEIFAKQLPSGKPYDENRWSGTSIDSTSPKGEAFLRKRFKRIHDWGYRYIKIDGLHFGSPSRCTYGNRSYKSEVFGNAKIYNPDMTFIEGYHKGMKMLHEEAPDTFMLGCTIAQNQVSFAPLFGFVDAMRVGPDNDGAIRGIWSKVTLGADYAGNLWFLNNRVWYNDPDPLYVRESIPLEKAKWMASWLAVSGVLNTTSMQYSHLKPERLDIIKRTLPAHCYHARPVDVLENKHPAIWQVENQRMLVIGLFNWSEKKATTITHSFERLGLDPKKKYEAFDYWENRYLGTLQNQLSEKLPAVGCRVLALREARPYPQLLSTSRHITQGLIDVKTETWNSKTKTLVGTSKVVANDPYKMRIICPQGFTATTIKTSDKMATVSKITQQSNGLVCVTIIPSKTETLKWKVIF